MLDVVLGHFALIAVAKEYRWQGIATKLINAAGTQLLARDAATICVCMLKNHPVGPHLFEKFANENDLELVVAEKLKPKESATDKVHVTLVNRRVLGSTTLKVSVEDYEHVK